MEPFSIVCKSCAAKLKVTKPAAVGQVLACPKCGTMIRVAAPAGWVAPESPKDSTSGISQEDVADQNSDDALGGNFEDIEDILGSPQKPATQRKPAQRPRSGKPKKRSLETASPQQRSNRSPQSADQNARSAVRQRQPAPSSHDNQPVLPNDQWTSESTRRRKRLVTLIVGVLGSLLVLSVIGVAIVLNLPDDDPVPVVKLDENPVAEKTDSVVDDELDKGLLDDRDLTDSGTLSDSNNGDDRLVGGPPVVDGNPPNVDDVPLVGNDPPAVSVAPGNPDNTNPPAIANQEQNPEDPADRPTTQQEEEPSGRLPIAKLPASQSPFDGTPQLPNEGQIDVEPSRENNPTEVGLVESFESDLGELSSLLEQSDISIRELRDLAASIRTRQLVGLAKYIVTQPEAEKLDLQKQLEMPIGGLMFDAAPLARVAQSLAAITGIPITIDARSIVAAGKEASPMITSTIKDTTVDAALTELLSGSGLVHRVDSDGIVIGVFPDQSATQLTLNLPAIAQIDDESKQNFLVTIQVLIEPKAWVRQDDPATIELVNDQIVVTCSESIQHQITELLGKLGASYDLSQTPSDAAALAITQSRSKAVQANLAKAPQMVHSVRKEIGDMLNQLQAKTGVTVMVNWEQVIKDGWSPQTVIPGNVREPTIGKTIAEIARAMNLTYRTVDEKTIVLTTFEDAANTIDLEVYPVAKLVPNKLSAEMMRKLVTETLGAQLQSEKVRYIYEPNCHCLIVSAPQQLQRQIEGLIDRLVDELKVDRQPDQTQLSKQ